MKDYKELAQLKLVPLKYEDIVSELREETAYPPYADMLMKRAAEAVEQLAKERDAAIADLGKACYINLRNVRANACSFCLKLPICAKIPGKQNYCCADWEWRGVQEAEYEETPT